MGFMVYWTDANGNPGARLFDELIISDALKFSETQRKAGMQFVTMTSELSNSVGKPGVDSVENGKTPDGQTYSWMKRRDA